MPIASRAPNLRPSEPIDDHPAVTAPRADRATLHAAMRSMQVDGLTAEVVGELRRQGLRAILLKGAAVARWLYGEGDLRTYRDTDLLIDPATLERVQAALGALGYEPFLPQSEMPGWDVPALLWVRVADRAAVDLHTSIKGISAPPPQVWATLARDTTTLTVAGCEVEVLPPAARALHVALHAAQHGNRLASAQEDLRRAVTLVPRQTWLAAVALARELDAAGAFAAGLRTRPEGVALADELAIHERAPVASILRSENAPAMALGWEQLARAPGTRARLSLLWWEAFPTRRFMRIWSPLARRGRAGMAAARLLRMATLLRHAVPALRAWHRARRRSGR